MGSKWTAEKDKLYALLIVEGKSFAEVGRLYNCSGSNIKNVALRLELPLTQRRSVNPAETFGKGQYKVPKVKCLNCGNLFVAWSRRYSKYCCIKCQQAFEHKEGYKKLLVGDPSIMRANYSPKAYKQDILEEQGGVCDICHSLPIHNGKPLTFILDHIDGHAANNKRDNLRCICPNCDSQLDTYKSKNKHGDRHYYRYRYNGSALEEIQGVENPLNGEG